MPVQQTLPEFDRPTPPRRVEPAPAPVWLQRTSLAVFVVFCLYIGVVLCMLPWTQYWNQNAWLLAHPTWHTLSQQGWFRGLVSGFGLLDAWIGISEVFHYREYRPKTSRQ